MKVRHRHKHAAPTEVYGVERVTLTLRRGRTFELIEHSDGSVSIRTNVLSHVLSIIPHASNVVIIKSTRS